MRSRNIVWCPCRPEKHPYGHFVRPPTNWDETLCPHCHRSDMWRPRESYTHIARCLICGKLWWDNRGTPWNDLPDRLIHLTPEQEAKLL